MLKKMSILLICMLLVGAAAFGAYQKYTVDKNKLIRLHVIANSNTFYDQQLKYQIKDQIVTETAFLFNQANNIDEARKIADANTERIKQIAMNEIKRQGFDYQVNVIRGNFDFPKKTYTIKDKGEVTSLTLPAGRYEAVRVVIGSGRGANWWCVLYPPLCFVNLGQTVPQSSLPLASAVEKKEYQDADNTGGQLIEDHDTTDKDNNKSLPNQNEVLEHSELSKSKESGESNQPRIEYRFRLVDIFKSIFS